MGYHISILTPGDGGYEHILGPMRADLVLREYARDAADCHLREHPRKVWVVAHDPGGVLAWCAYEPADEPGVEVKACDSVELPRAWDTDVWSVLYEVRQTLIGARTAVTYVYDQPLWLHLVDGWRPAGVGWDRGRRWTRLVWPGAAGG